jgi:hypothetical protein
MLMNASIGAALRGIALESGANAGVQAGLAGKTVMARYGLTRTAVGRVSPIVLTKSNAQTC